MRGAAPSSSPPPTHLALVSSMQPHERCTLFAAAPSLARSALIPALLALRVITHTHGVSEAASAVACKGSGGKEFVKERWRVRVVGVEGRALASVRVCGGGGGAVAMVTRARGGSMGGGAGESGAQSDV